MSIGRPHELVLIRHAESERNKIKGGNTYFPDDESRRPIRGVPDQDINITPEGITQSLKTGFALRSRFGTPDYFYHSGYRRTMETMKGILAAYDESECRRINVRRNHLLRERDPGYCYDMTTAEAEAAFPYLKEYWKTFGGFLARPPGGESLADVANRVYLFLNMLFRDRQGKKVFVVTHGGTLRCFRFLLERWTYEQALKWPPGQSPQNCGVTGYVFHPKSQRLVLHDYNTVYWQ